jgi:hypothetical protein
MGCGCGGNRTWTPDDHAADGTVVPPPRASRRWSPQGTPVGQAAAGYFWNGPAEQPAGPASTGD